MLIMTTLKKAVRIIGLELPFGLNDGKVVVLSSSSTKWWQLGVKRHIDKLIEQSQALFWWNGGSQTVPKYHFDSMIHLRASYLFYNGGY